MKLGIIAAMAEELAVLLPQLCNSEKHHIYQLTFVTGMLAECDVVVVQSGIGKVHAAWATTLLIERFGVHAVINTGSAGSLSGNLAIGDIVLGTKTAAHDVDVTAFGYERGQIPKMPTWFIADSQLLNWGKNAAATTCLHAVTAPIVSADTFVGTEEARVEVVQHFPEAVCTEMEGAAVAHICFLAHVPCLIVRAISDNADGAAPMSFDTFLQMAGERSAQLVCALARQAGQAS